MPRLISILSAMAGYISRTHRAWIYMRKLNYSRRLAWAKAAR